MYMRRYNWRRSTIKKFSDSYVFWASGLEIELHDRQKDERWNNLFLLNSGVRTYTYYILESQHIN